jgi:hypothetical protein
LQSRAGYNTPPDVGSGENTNHEEIMRIRSPFYLLLLLLSVAMFSIACSDSSDPLGSAEQDISGDNSMDAINLDQEYGGLSFSDEPDAFGDALLKAEAELGDQLAASEGDEDDLLREHPEFDRPDVRRTYVRILWGRLDGRPEGDLERTEAAFERVNWDGTLTVDGGVVALKKTILFERATDWRLPRDDRHSLGWKSMTGPHKDGILVCVISRPNDEGVVSGSVEFSTGPLTVSFDLAELDGLD